MFKFSIFESLSCNLKSFYNDKLFFSLGCRSFFNGACLYRKAPDPGMKLKEKEWQLEFHQIEPNSRMKIFDKKPIKLKLIKGKTYKWCACGFSHAQPFCDRTHHVPKLRVHLRPLIFQAPETKEVWLCLCKKTKNPPFCDGSHRSKEVQDAIKDI